MDFELPDVSTKDSAKPSRRRRFLIYPKFQATLILVQAFSFFATCALLIVQAHRAYDHLRDVGAAAHIPFDHVYFQFLEAQEITLLRFELGAVGMGMVLSILLTLWLSNRVAGPIIRLRGYMEAIREKGARTSDLQFRKRDFFSDLPEIVNGALTKLQRARPKLGPVKPGAKSAARRSA